MLEGINPLLTGEILLHLDRMGHSDAVVIADAHFPAWALGAPVIDLPGTSSPHVLAAVRTVLPLDDEPAMDLMASADGSTLLVHQDLMSAAGVIQPRFVDRHEFYELSTSARVILRTGETRQYGNALMRKGLVIGP